MKEIILLLTLLVVSYKGINQEISTQTLTRVNKFLWEHGQMYVFDLKEKTLKTSRQHFDIYLIGTSLSDSQVVNAYEIGARVFHAKRYILLEKINVQKSKYHYIFIGETSNLDELKELFVVLNKYNFQFNIKNRCYEIIILDSYNSDILGGNRSIEVDSLWK